MHCFLLSGFVLIALTWSTNASWVWKDDPTDYEHVGCFADTGKKSVLTQRKKIDDTTNIIQKCRDLAFSRGYKLFAVQSPNCYMTNDEADNQLGPATGCENGEGARFKYDVYRITTQLAHTYIGCFKDKENSPAIAGMTNYGRMDGESIINQCHTLAVSLGHSIFAVQASRACYTTNEAGYDKYGNSKDCIAGAGANGIGTASDVYQVNNAVWVAGPVVGLESPVDGTWSDYAFCPEMSEAWGLTLTHVAPENRKIGRTDYIVRGIKMRCNPDSTQLLGEDPTSEFIDSEFVRCNQGAKITKVMTQIDPTLHRVYNVQAMCDDKTPIVGEKSKQKGDWTDYDACDLEDSVCGFRIKEGLEGGFKKILQLQLACCVGGRLDEIGANRVQ